MVDMKKVRITKVRGKDAKLPIGMAREGWRKTEPQIGDPFVLYLHDGSIFRTSAIQEVTEGAFKTSSSAYKIELLQTEEVHEDDEKHEMGDTERIQEWKCIPRDVSIMCRDGVRIKGKVDLGHESRVSDLFTRGKSPFIVVFDASVKGEMGQVIVLNKSAIDWVTLEESGNIGKH